MHHRGCGGRRRLRAQQIKSEQKRSLYQFTRILLAYSIEAVESSFCCGVSSFAVHLDTIRLVEKRTVVFSFRLGLVCSSGTLEASGPPCCNSGRGEGDSGSPGFQGSCLEWQKFPVTVGLDWRVSRKTAFRVWSKPSSSSSYLGCWARRSACSQAHARSGRL